MKFKWTPFLKFHAVLAGLFLLTYIFGILMDSFSIFRSIHPYTGIALLIVPILYYLLSNKKKPIKVMLKSSFKSTNNKWMNIARVSTVLFMIQLVLMIITGLLMFTGLYGNFTIYRILSSLHKSAVILFPLLLIIHGGSRLYIKSGMSKG